MGRGLGWPGAEYAVSQCGPLMRDTSSTPDVRQNARARLEARSDTHALRNLAISIGVLWSAAGWAVLAAESDFLLHPPANKIAVSTSGNVRERIRVIVIATRKMSKKLLRLATLSHADPYF